MFLISNVYATNRRYHRLKANKQAIASYCLIYLTLKGKVAIGKARYLLNIVYLTLGCSTHLFSEVHYSVQQEGSINLVFIPRQRVDILCISKTPRSYTLALQEASKTNLYPYNLRNNCLYTRACRFTLQALSCKRVP